MHAMLSSLESSIKRMPKDLACPTRISKKRTLIGFWIHQLHNNQCQTNLKQVESKISTRKARCLTMKRKRNNHGLTWTIYHPRPILLCTTDLSFFIFIVLVLRISIWSR